MPGYMAQPSAMMRVVLCVCVCVCGCVGVQLGLGLEATRRQGDKRRPKDERRLQAIEKATRQKRDRCGWETVVWRRDLIDAVAAGN